MPATGGVGKYLKHWDAPGFVTGGVQVPVYDDERFVDYNDPNAIARQLLLHDEHGIYDVYAGIAPGPFGIALKDAVEIIEERARPAATTVTRENPTVEVPLTDQSSIRAQQRWLASMLTGMAEHQAQSSRPQLSSIQPSEGDRVGMETIYVVTPTPIDEVTTAKISA